MYSKYQRKQILSLGNRFLNHLYCRHKDELDREKLSEANLVVFGGPREPFSVVEFNELKDWLNGGGRALVLLSDGGEKQSGCNMNYLLEE